MVENYGAHLAGKIHVIYPLIDAANFALRSHPPADASLSILSVGRLTEYKGLIDLVEACRILRDEGVSFGCRIVGEGEERSALSAAIQQCGLAGSVELLGPLPNEDVARLLESASVFALPCVIARNGDRDGMPIVLIEAMARGVPVVATDVIGLPELVRPNVGILVPPRNPAALAGAFRRIADAGSSGQEEMGRAGRDLVERELDADIGAARLAALFEHRPALAAD
jgi:glycosyltransferase involved in cell wall biosynthesis